jgi:nicotinamidase-related amidase
MADAAARRVHLCIDVQTMFAADTDWCAPWLNRTLPAIEALVERDPARTVFTRFIPAQTAEHAVGAWQDYYRRWPAMTGERLTPELIDLVPSLQRFVPPAHVLDKSVYSPWLGTQLHAALQQRGIDTLVITGGETDVCVMAAIIGAIDLGYRIILPSDAVFGSADETHDAALTLFHSRFGQQLSTCTTGELIDNWTEYA